MDIIALVAQYGAWSWVVGGLVLLALELVVPGGIFLWLGGSVVVAIVGIGLVIRAARHQRVSARQTGRPST